MPLQEQICAFALKVKVAFKVYLNEERASAKILMNAIKPAQYFYCFANSEQKIVEKDKIQKIYLHSEMRRAIKEYYIDLRGQLLHMAQKKRDITKPQAFVYNAFDYIKRIHTADGHDSYKRTF